MRSDRGYKDCRGEAQRALAPGALVLIDGIGLLRLRSGQWTGHLSISDSDGRRQYGQAVDVEIFVKIEAKEIGRCAVRDWRVQQITEAAHSVVGVNLGKKVRFNCGCNESERLTADADGFEADFAVAGAERFGDGNELGGFDAKGALTAGGHEHFPVGGIGFVGAGRSKE